mmetsp:Transcript_5003/g.9445  ORF Transcript_5003/g.9445 Transcript_5003/m.9445 type:complete len:125 (+) Transcript_5003:70-444(+)
MPPINGDQNGSGRRLTKNEKRRLKKKNEPKKAKEDVVTKKSTVSENEDADLQVVVEYVPADVQSMVETDPVMAQFKEIFEKFSSTNEVTVGEPSEEDAAKKAAEEEAKKNEGISSRRDESENSE